MHSREPNKIIAQDIEAIVLGNVQWDQFKNVSILITGADGFLASYLVKVLLHASMEFNLDLKIYAVVRSAIKSNRIKHLDGSEGLVLYEHDMSSPLPSDFPITDWIIHAASKASPKFYGSDPIGTFKPNSVGTLNLLEHAVINHSSKFLFISSGEVYGEVDSGVRIDETAFGKLDTMKIRSAYGESKRMGELLTAIWADQYNICGLVVRPFHTYGPGLYLDDGRVFSDFVSNVVNREPIVLNSNGKAKRPFCYISDAILGLLTILTSGSSGNAYNLGNPDGNISILDLAIMLSRLVDTNQVEVIRNHGDNDNGGYLKSPIMQQDISIDKLRKLGWKPYITLQEGFRRMIMSYL